MTAANATHTFTHRESLFLEMGARLMMTERGGIASSSHRRRRRRGGKFKSPAIRD